MKVQQDHSSFYVAVHSTFALIYGLLPARLWAIDSCMKMSWVSVLGTDKSRIAFVQQILEILYHFKNNNKNMGTTAVATATHQTMLPRNVSPFFLFFRQCRISSDEVSYHLGQS